MQRDKVVVHNEVIEKSVIPNTKWDKIEELVNYAKKITTIIGIGYLSINYEDDRGNYFLSDDALKASRALKQLLKEANVIKSS